MFGANELVGKKYFRSRTEGQATRRLMVTSIFYTLQGEGPFAGLPAVFVRLSKCNLNCVFCDTYFDSGEWMNFTAIMDGCLKSICEFHNCSLRVAEDIMKDVVLVITGGEPMLQDLLPEFIALVKKDFRAVQIESNGTSYLDIPDDTCLVVSPKVNERSNQYMSCSDKIKARANYFKFIVSADAQSPYHIIPVEFILTRRFRERTFVSPMNIYARPPAKIAGDGTLEERSTKDEVISFWEDGLLNREVNQRNHEYAARYALHHGLRLNLQMHLYASLA